MAPSSAILPIWAVLLAGVTGASPYRPERGRCRPESEYFIGTLGICCTKCPPGSFAQRLCTAADDTVCVPCAEGEYTELWNYVRECHVCPTCDPRRDMVVAVNCSGSVRTRCQCRPGYHCAGGLDCMDCEAHSLCGPGRQVTQPGTSLRDTQCGKCPLGTFKPASSLEPCQNHTKCRAQGLLEIAPGTDVSDAECGPTPTNSPLSVTPVTPKKSEQLEMDVSRENSLCV
ncbi:tumor necrosis factor receptor superfamily member 3-like [Mobula birostris]|uniref:tumor necrosis factor receptor superfamily member 3-like n=1 Tax=Mobula birostris TaxID=1983395 RepID=UPI003B2825EB